ncbi:hypothetical protein BGX27_007097, partial [Mortierella sp. AM989]
NPFASSPGPFIFKNPFAIPTSPFASRPVVNPPRTFEWIHAQAPTGKFWPAAKRSVTRQSIKDLGVPGHSLRHVYRINADFVELLVPTSDKSSVLQALHTIGCQTRTYDPLDTKCIGHTRIRDSDKKARAAKTTLARLNGQATLETDNRVRFHFRQQAEAVLQRLRQYQASQTDAD